LTTFTALSTALALNTSKYPQTENRKTPKARADVAVVLGPSVGGARARVLLSVDGLEVKVWGQRDYDQEEAESDEENGEDAEEEEGSEEESEDERDAEEPPDSDEEELVTDEERSRPTSPAGSSSDSSRSESSSRLLQPPQRRRQPFSPRPSGISQTEEAQILVAAERLLSRTLANACAEDDNGLGSETAPTRMHVLIRAPRRFNHPSWIPRQNLTTSLDSVYDEFLDHSGLTVPTVATKKSKPKRSGIKTEGVWVRCAGALSTEEVIPETVDEEDEMIWWSWDGKIVGFSDW